MHHNVTKHPYTVKISRHIHLQAPHADKTIKFTENIMVNGLKQNNLYHVMLPRNTISLMFHAHIVELVYVNIFVFMHFDFKLTVIFGKYFSR